MTKLIIMLTAISTAVFISCASTWAQEKPPPPKIEIIKPEVGQELNGTVDIRLRIIAEKGVRLPSSVYVGLGGPPWERLKKESNIEWKGRLDSTMVPNGMQSLLVVTNNNKVKGSIKISLNNPMKHFFADLHSHTGYSDGTLLPSIAHDYARNVAKLDVFSLTDHLEGVSETEWIDTRNEALKANEEGAFVVIPGLEWTKKQGHTCIFDPKTRKWPVDTSDFYKAAADANVVVKFNHPGDGTKVFDGLAYSKIGDKAIQMMEVRRVNEEKAFIRALNLGWHLAPDGSDDTHSANWGNNRSWTVILAPGLSQRNIWDALKRRHFYSTQDRNCTLDFEVGEALMGDILQDPPESLDVIIAVEDEDRSDKIAKIELYKDGVVVHTDESKDNARRLKIRENPEPGEHYYFIKVTQADGNMIWSAPVWVNLGNQ